MSLQQSPAVRAAAPTRSRVAAGIRADISDGTLPPGSKISERDICETYDVSRTVVRETIRQLEAEGFVTVKPNVGAVVAEITYADAQSLFEIRGALESLACSLFAQRGSLANKHRLVETIKVIERAMDGGSLEEILAAKDDFYDALFEGAGNPELTATLQLLHARIQLLRRYSLSAKGRNEYSLNEIKEIVRAIVAGDAEGARLAGVHHVAQASYAALPRIFETTSAHSPDAATS